MDATSVSSISRVLVKPVLAFSFDISPVACGPLIRQRAREPQLPALAFSFCSCPTPIPVGPLRARALFIPSFSFGSHSAPIPRWPPKGMGVLPVSLFSFGSCSAPLPAGVLKARYPRPPVLASSFGLQSDPTFLFSPPSSPVSPGSSGSLSLVLQDSSGSTFPAEDPTRVRQMQTSALHRLHCLRERPDEAPTPCAFLNGRRSNLSIGPSRGQRPGPSPIPPRQYHHISHSRLGQPSMFDMTGGSRLAVSRVGGADHLSWILSSRFSHNG